MPSGTHPSGVTGRPSPPYPLSPDLLPPPTQPQRKNSITATLALDVVNLRGPRQITCQCIDRVYAPVPSFWAKITGLQDSGGLGRVSGGFDLDALGPPLEASVRSDAPGTGDSAIVDEWLRYDRDPRGAADRPGGALAPRAASCALPPGAVVDDAGDLWSLAAPDLPGSPGSPGSSWVRRRRPGQRSRGSSGGGGVELAVWHGWCGRRLPQSRHRRRECEQHQQPATAAYGVRGMFQHIFGKAGDRSFQRCTGTCPARHKEQLTSAGGTALPGIPGILGGPAAPPRHATPAQQRSREAPILVVPLPVQMGVGPLQSAVMEVN
eukprot:gene12596-biopygen22989